MITPTPEELDRLRTMLAEPVTVVEDDETLTWYDFLLIGFAASLLSVVRFLGGRA